jgi:iron complex outermembrane receptor protein
MYAGLTDLADLSIEELGKVSVTSVSRRGQPLQDAPASVYVIPGDEVRRSGITSLAEALRLAPNLQVAALDARQYAITARGFNSNIANKLLVMVDGRTVYSPLFSGTFWDAQDFVPADLDRIEVISGPAGTAWGTNAVNGIINILTRSAAETQGPSVSISGGNLERSVVGRYGVSLGEGMALRAHVRAFHRDATELRSGGDADDATTGQTAGLRGDWTDGADSLMFSTGIYRSETDSRPLYGKVELSGGHLLGRWARRLSAVTDVELQAYYDHTDRKDRFLLQEEADLFDVEGKWRYLSGAHRWLLGTGYRRAKDRADPGLLFAFLPAERRQEWYSVFAQDEMQLSGSFSLTLGTRFEKNPYSGWENLPSVRVAYKPVEDSLWWAAVSRAVRSPARLDREIFTPPRPPFIVAGGPDFDSEVANVLELGWRGQPGATASASVTAFLQDYDRLRSAQIVGGSVLIDNQIEGQISGVEAWGEWLVTRAWKLSAGGVWQEHDLRLKSGSNDPVGPSNLGNDPKLQWSVRSSHTFGPRWDLSVNVRHVDELPEPEVAAYTATDFYMNWRPRQAMQVAFGVRNAFDPEHVEFDSGTATGEIPRSAFVMLTYQPK